MRQIAPRNTMLVGKHDCRCVIYCLGRHTKNHALMEILKISDEFSPAASPKVVPPEINMVICIIHNSFNGMVPYR